VPRIVPVRIAAEVDQLDANGDVKKNANGYPYKEWVKVSTQMMASVNYRNRSAEMVDHLKLIWTMRQGEWDALWKFNDTIGLDCANCGTAESVVTAQWVCPTCKNPHFDMLVNDYDTEEVQKAIIQPMDCDVCGERNFPEELVQCLADCGKPVRQSIFDVNIKVRQNVTPMKNGKNKYAMQFGGYERKALAPHHTVPQKGKPAASAPYDLPAMLLPATEQEQIRVFGRGAAEVRVTDAATAYGQKVAKPQRTPVPSQQRNIPGTDVPEDEDIPF